MRREKEQEGMSRQRRSCLRKGAAGAAGETQRCAGQESAPLGEPSVPPRMVAFAFSCHECGSWSTSQRENRKKEALPVLPILPSAGATAPVAGSLLGALFICISFLFASLSPRLTLHRVILIARLLPLHISPARTPFPIFSSQRRT